MHWVCGREVTADEAADLGGISVQTFRQRIMCGLTAEQAIAWPRGKRLPARRERYLLDVSHEPDVAYVPPVLTEEQELEESLKHASNRNRWEIAFSALSGSKYFESVIRLAVQALIESATRALDEKRSDAFSYMLWHDANNVRAVVGITHALHDDDARQVDAIAQSSDLRLLALALRDGCPSNGHHESELEKAAARYLETLSNGGAA